jgi:hypothetical protein
MTTNGVYILWERAVQSPHNFVIFCGHSQGESFFQGQDDWAGSAILALEVLFVIIVVILGRGGTRC